MTASPLLPVPLFISHKHVQLGGKSIDDHEYDVSSVIDDILFGKDRVCIINFEICIKE
jgi:hypothetical protein